MKRLFLLLTLFFFCGLTFQLQTEHGQTAGFTDDFNDNVRDATKWTIGTLHDSNFNSQVQVAETSQQLRVTIPAGVIGYSGYVTASAWNFNNASTSVQVVQTAGLSNDTVFALGIDANNRYRFVVEGGQLYFQYKVNGGASSSTNITYSSTQHKFWRFRHDQATDQIVFETSSDGATWVARRTVARQFANTALKIEIDGGSFQSGGSSTTAIFDNFRLDTSGVTPTPTPTPTPSDDPILPQQKVDTTYPTNTRTPIFVPSGGDLQAAINSAVPGDTITLAPNGTYSAPEGGFVLKNKNTSSTSWIIIRSSSTDFDSTGPIPTGTRVDGTSATQTGQMPKILSQVNNTPAISTEAGAHHYRLVGLELTFASNVTQSTGATVQLGADYESISANVPSYMIVDRCYVHGKDAGNYKRGVALQGKQMAIVDSYISNFKGDFDTQAICGTNGEGPFGIYNNYLEASGENIMFGGDDPAILNLVPSDIEIKRNLLTKNINWQNAAGITVKNLFELKNARRVLFDGNILDKCWSGQGQDYAINIKSVDQDEGGNCNWCISEHVTLSNNKIRNVANAIDIGGRQGVTQSVNHVKIYNTLIYNLLPTWGHPYGMQFLIRGGANYVKIIHVTSEGSAVIIQPEDNSEVNPNLTLRDNIFERGSYGIKSNSEGTSALSTTFGPLTATSYQKNLLINTSDEPGNPDPTQTATDTTLVSRYPNPCTTPNTACAAADTFVASTWSNVGFVDRANGNYRLGAGSPFKGKASDGKDIGVDQDAIEAAIGSQPSGGGSTGILMSDDFNDNAIDQTKWSIGTLHDTRFNSQVQAAEQTQQLKITTPQGALGYSGYVTASPWDFTNARATVEVLQIVASGNDTVFALGIDANNRYRFVVEDGVLYFQYKVNGGASSSTNVPYSPTQHRFWRFRHNQATDQIVFETSVDGINWVGQRTVARQFANTAVKIEIDSGSFVSSGSTTTAIFDNFKLER
jgi:hypothetical protein